MYRKFPPQNVELGWRSTWCKGVGEFSTDKRDSQSPTVSGLTLESCRRGSGSCRATKSILAPSKRLVCKPSGGSPVKVGCSKVGFFAGAFFGFTRRATRVGCYGRAFDTKTGLAAFLSFCAAGHVYSGRQSPASMFSLRGGSGRSMATVVVAGTILRSCASTSVSFAARRRRRPISLFRL